jgi:hypothetical protein
MKWIDAPPCGRMDLVTANDGLLDLEGPSVLARAVGAGAAAFGATFATTALGFIRLPVPMPFKLIPIAFGVIGGSVAALGLGSAVSKHWVRVTREGIEQRWRWGPLKERSVQVPAAQIVDVEVQSLVHTSTDDFGSQTSVSYRLHVVTKDGKAHAIEDFGLSAQAKLRKEQIERILGRPSRA